eukprot:g9564.t2
MKKLELFPRGKGVAEAGSAASSSTPSSIKQDGKKRKAPATSPAAGGREEEWLFGAGGYKDKSKQSSRGGKRAQVGSGMLVEHSGRGPRLEMVSFKKLNKGTLALGVVFKINVHDMVVSLPSSLTGVVRRNEVSDLFHRRATKHSNSIKHSGRGSRGKGRYFDESNADENKPLTDLFQEGQVVRCAIISLAKEVGGRHIELSLRASVLNNGLSLSQLTKGSGVYGSVTSAEDHGYVVSLGLDGVTAFLPKKDAPEAGLEAGQPVETVIQTVKAAARTVTLSADPSLVSSALAKGTAFDLRSLKPGMLVDTIVDSVLSNGLLVSFLGFFAGCVDHNHMPVVSGDGKEEAKGWRPLFRPGPEPVRARVLLVDYVNKAIRLTLRPHLLEMRPPSGLPPTGALLEGEVVRVDPSLGLLLRVPSTEQDDGTAATGNAPAAKKETGQGRRERRAAAAAAAVAATAAAVAAKGEERGKEEADIKWGSVGAYVHISRISDERVEHVEKSYKPGQKVRCRVTGSSLVEGWSAASLRPSILQAAVLRYQDLKPAALVEGEVAAVEAFGLLVKLGEGVRALVSKNHLGDVTVKNPKARFKVGARVKGRVLTVDAGSSKATLTLKRSLVKDKREPITSYENAKKKEDMACTGFVTKVAPFGLHVSFYDNVFGLLPAKSLRRHGIQDPAEAFTAGQVVGCVIRLCDVSSYPPKITLSLDVAGKTEQIDGAAAADQSDDEVAAAECPFSPGEMVSGVVSSTQNTDGMVVMDLTSSTSSPPSPFSASKKNKKNAKPATARGVLPHAHLGDHASVCGEATLAAALAPGTTVEELLVLEVDRTGVPIVSLKPLLLQAVKSRSEKEQGQGQVDDRKAFIPKAASEVSVGDLLCGYVSRVESFGLFVKFLGRFTALCPRSMVADRVVEDPSGLFTEGDSVRCVVQRVDEDTERVVVTLNRTTVPPSSALYLRSLLSETFAANAAAAPPDTDTSNPGQGAGAVPVRPWGRLEFGATTNAVVVALKEYGVVLNAVASTGKGKKEKAGADTGGQLMVCPLEHAMDGVEEGNEVKVRILGMDLEKGVLDVTMDTELVKAGRSKRLRAMVALEPGETVSAKVVLAKPAAKWAVAASKDGRLFVMQVADFHCPHRSCQDAGLCLDTPEATDQDSAAASLSEGKEFVAKVGESFTPGLEGYWEAQEDGAGASGCNPYAGAVLVVVEEDGCTKRKTRRRSRGESLDLGGKDTDAGAAFDGDDGVQDVGAIMKAGRVSLGKIKKGAKVVCEVTSIHWDRLDVKVAVRYPKSYGPHGGKGRDDGIGDMEEDEDEDADKDDETEEQSVSTGKEGGSKKRRRSEMAKAEANKAQAKANKVEQRKQIVRIRAKVHCTAAGPPGLDAPVKSKSKGQDTRGDDAANLPDWHPLQKFHVGQALGALVLHSEDVVQKKDSNLIFRLLELGLLDSDLAQVEGEDTAGDADADAAVPAVAWWGETPPKRGQVHRGVITEVAEHGVLVSLSTSVRGLVPLKHLSADAGVKKKFSELFKRGMGVRVLVRKVDEERRGLILSLIGVPGKDVLPDSALPAMSPTFNADEEPEESGDAPSDSPVEGDIVEGTVDSGVKAWAPPCLMVRLDRGGMGRVCVTEMAEEPAWRENPLNRFKDGTRVKCRVLASLPSHQQQGGSKRRSRKGVTGDSDSSTGGANAGPVELSLRQSRLDESLDVSEATKREGPPEVGSTAKCYVVDTGKSGCFVRLQGGVNGRVLLKHLSDRYVSNPRQEFPSGKLVAGKVLSKDEATGNVSLTLQPSVVLDGKGGEGGGLSWGSESLKAGLKVKGKIAAVKDFGVFIQVDDSEVRGMCHRSEAAERSIKDLSTVYDVGDLVKAVVLKVERSKKRLSLGLKPSYFEGDPDSSDEDNEEEESDAAEDSDDDSEAGSSDADADAMVAAAAMDVSEGEESPDDDDNDEDEDEEDSDDEEEEEDEEEDEEDSSRILKRARGVFGDGDGKGLGSGGGGANNAFSLNFGDLGSMGGAGASSDEDDSDDDSDDDAAASGKGHRSRKKAKERREEEERIAARERALQDEDAVPETAGDYERLLVATPNDSLLWVKFMAFKLSLADVEGARGVCERALKAVSFREEQERFNLWVALINLEHKYGSAATLKAVSERACQNCNPKKVYLHMAEMHEKAQETDECEEVFQAAAKKFRHSKKVWVAYQLSRLKRGDDAGAREALQRSFQSLARHKHVSVISRFAQNEFEHGSVERGRSVFEGLMASYPKRLDLWNVYVDKEVMAGDIRAARNLLERLTGMDFNAKRMKGVFKKYLQFEMEHGDEAGVEAVKAKATDYVASLAG